MTVKNGDRRTDASRKIDREGKVEEKLPDGPETFDAEISLITLKREKK